MACVAPLQDVLSVRGSCTTVGAWASAMEGKGMFRVGEGDIVILCILGFLFQNLYFVVLKPPLGISSGKVYAVTLVMVLLPCNWDMGLVASQGAYHRWRPCWVHYE